MRQLLPMAPCWAMCHRTHNVALSRRHRVCSDGESLQSHTITLLCVRRGHIEGGVSGFKVEGARPSLADLVEGGIDRQRHRRGLENNSTQLLCRERTLNQQGLVAVPLPGTKTAVVLNDTSGNDFNATAYFLRHKHLGGALSALRCHGDGRSLVFYDPLRRLVLQIVFYFPVLCFFEDFSSSQSMT